MNDNLTHAETAAMRLFRLMAEGRGWVGWNQLRNWTDADGNDYHRMAYRLQDKGLVKVNKTRIGAGRIELVSAG